MGVFIIYLLSYIRLKKICLLRGKTANKNAVYEYKMQWNGMQTE